MAQRSSSPFSLPAAPALPATPPPEIPPAAPLAPAAPLGAPPTGVGLPPAAAPATPELSGGAAFPPPQAVMAIAASQRQRGRLIATPRAYGAAKLPLFVRRQLGGCLPQIEGQRATID